MGSGQNKDITPRTPQHKRIGMIVTDSVISITTRLSDAKKGACAGSRFGDNGNLRSSHAILIEVVMRKSRIPVRVVLFLSLVFPGIGGALLGADYVPPKSSYTSQAEADARFEQELARLKAGSGGTPALADTRFLGPGSADHQARVRSIKKNWDKNFRNAGKVIDLQQKPPPPPNGLFKKAKKGGFVKTKSKRSGKKRKGKKKRR